MSKRHLIYLCSLLLLVSGLALSCKSGGGTSATTTSTSTSTGEVTTGSGTTSSDNYQVLASSSNPKLVSDSEKLLDPSSGDITIVPEGTTISGFAALGSAQVTFSDGTTVTTDASGVLQSTQIPQSVKDAATTDATQLPEVIITPPAGSNLQPETIPAPMATSTDTNDVPIGLVVLPEKLTFATGEIRSLFAMRENASGKLIKATNVTWTSSDSTVASIKNSAEKKDIAIIAGLKAGTATITAKILDNSNNEITDTANITIADSSPANTIHITGNVTKDGVAPSGAVVVFNMPPPPDASDVKLQPFIGKCTKSGTTCTYTIFINIPPDASGCKDFQPVVVDVPDSTGKTVHYFGNPDKINLCTTDGGKTKSQDFATGNPFSVPVPPPPVEKIIRHAWREVESTFGPRFNEFGEVLKFATAASGTFVGGPFNGWCYVKDGNTVTLTSTPVVNNQCVGPEKLVITKSTSSTPTSLIVTFTRYIRDPKELTNIVYKKVEAGSVTDTLDTTGKKTKTEVTVSFFRPEISETTPVGGTKFVVAVEVTLGADGKPTSIKETVGEQYFVGADASAAGPITTSCGTPDAKATGCSSYTKTVTPANFGTTSTVIEIPLNGGNSTRSVKAPDGTTKNITSTFDVTIKGNGGGSANENVTLLDNQSGSISFIINSFADTATSNKRATGELLLTFKKPDGTLETPKKFTFAIWIGGVFTLSDGSKIFLPPGTLIITFPDSKTAFFPPDFVPVVG